MNVKKLIYRCSMFLIPVFAVFMFASFQQSTAFAEVECELKEKTLTISGYGEIMKADIMEYQSSVTEVTIKDGITRIGDSAFFNCTSLKEITIPTSVESIGEYAFEECTKLQTVTFESESQLKSIGEYAFVGCAALENIGLPSKLMGIGNYAFLYCINLKKITIPTSVESIGDGAFAGVQSVQNESENANYLVIDEVLYNKDKTTVLWVSPTISGSFAVPEGVTRIGEYAFLNCTSLKEITIPASVGSIGNNAFDGCAALENITLPSKLTKIGEYVFFNCTSLKEITIPASVESIENDAFYGCAALKNITLPSKLTKIGEYAIFNCTNLKEITIPASVESIGKGAFRKCTKLQTVKFEADSQLRSIGNKAFDGCAALEKIDLQSNLTGIGEYAFLNCTSLKEITIPTSVESIGDGAFVGVQNVKSESENYSVDEVLYYKKEKTVLWVSPTISGSFAVFPEGVTRIGDSTFLNCTNLKEITIPASVASIGDSAFEDCSNLETVNFGDNSQLESIGNDAFYDCTLLENITLPSKLTKIGEYAIFNCTNLKEITIPASVKSIGDDAFVGCFRLQIVKFEADSQLISIGNDAFFSCTSLKGITIPASVKSIGDGAFTGVQNVKSESENYPLEGYVLYDNDNKTVLWASQEISESFAVPESVTRIGDYAFFNRTNLKEITIPASVKSIGDDAFGACFRLQIVKFEADSQLESIGNDAFYDCTLLENITLPSKLTKIGESAFLNCTNLKEITIPASVKSIGNNAFYGCEELEKIDLPSSLTKIGEYTFLNCISLQKITIPANVNSIGNDAFYGCTNLRKVVILGDSSNGLLEVSDNSFSGCSSELFIVPCKLRLTGVDDRIQVIYRHKFKNEDGTVGCGCGTNMSKLKDDVYYLKEQGCLYIYGKGKVEKEYIDNIDKSGVKAVYIMGVSEGEGKKISIAEGTFENLSLNAIELSNVDSCSLAFFKSCGGTEKVPDELISQSSETEGVYVQLAYLENNKDGPCKHNTMMVRILTTDDNILNNSIKVKVGNNAINIDEDKIVNSNRTYYFEFSVSHDNWGSPIEIDGEKIKCLSVIDYLLRLKKQAEEASEKNTDYCKAIRALIAYGDSKNIGG